MLADPGVETGPTPAAAYTPRQERIIAGFENIQRFVREHRRPPQHGEGRDIFERLYAVRLDRIRADPQCLDLLGPLDADGLLARAEPDAAADARTDDELLEALGVEADAPGDVTVLRHVRSNAERTSPEEVAQRKPCADFDLFRPRFDAAQAGLAANTLANLHHGKFERLLHRLFDGARLDVGLKDRFGGAVEPREWFLVPLAAIDEAMSRVKDGSIDKFKYDHEAARSVPV